MVREGKKTGVTLALIFVMMSIVMPVQSASALTWVDLEGVQHQLTDYRGKWVVINYWATWCPPCLDEIPELLTFSEQHASDSVVLGVSQEQVSREYLLEFVDNYFMSYPVLLGEAGSNTPFGRLRGLPTTFVVSPEGELVTQLIGGVTSKKLEATIKKHHGQMQNTRSQMP